MMRHHNLFTLARAIGCVVVLCASGCSSSKKTDDSTGAKVGSLDQFMNKGFDRKKKEFDHSFRSEFDKKTYSTDKTLKEQKFKTDEFTGKHDYTGSSDYKAKEFAQGTKMSREGKETFKDAGKEPKEADKTYATADSRYGSKQVKEGDKSFAGSDETYKTGEVRDAAKSQKKNVLPQILPKEDETGKSVYTEADVKRLLNRN